jgi:hypothetical protein
MVLFIVSQLLTNISTSPGTRYCECTINGEKTKSHRAIFFMLNCTALAIMFPILYLLNPAFLKTLEHGRCIKMAVSKRVKPVFGLHGNSKFNCSETEKRPEKYAGFTAIPNSTVPKSKRDLKNILAFLPERIICLELRIAAGFTRPPRWAEGNGLRGGGGEDRGATRGFGARGSGDP